MKYLFLLLLFTFSACTEPGTKKDTTTTETAQQPASPQIPLPDFNGDSAYAFVEKQVSFGPRVPNTVGQERCATYLVNKLKSYTPEVEVQEATVKAYDGTPLKCKNIMAYFHPEKHKRIMLCAHWDTRPWADQDSVNTRKPIDGANDGASGVGVLLEIARIISEKAPDVGVNIVFFDCEDYGLPSWETKYEDRNSYCLGSQYWANNRDKTKLNPDYGILLDMVGAKDARFLQEYWSMKYAPYVTQKVWRTASDLGYFQYFIFNQTTPITDDHFYINQLAFIPSIDIIDFDGNRPKGFGHFWHTHADNMSIIDKNTLKAVGQTLLGVIYGEKIN